MITLTPPRCQQATLITGVLGSGKTWALTQQLLEAAKNLRAVENNSQDRGSKHGSRSSVRGSEQISGSLLMVSSHGRNEALRREIDVNRPLGCTTCDVMTFPSLVRSIVQNYGSLVGNYTVNKRQLDRTEVAVFLHSHLDQLPLGKYRPLHSPGDAVRPMLEMFHSLAHSCIEPGAYLKYVEALEAELELAEVDGLVEEELPDCKKERAKAARARRLRELEAEAWREHVAGERDKANTYEAFEELKRQKGVTDFVDMVSMARRILKQSTSARAELSLRLSRLFVDDIHEYSPAMMDVISQIACSGIEVTATADPFLESWSPGRADNNTIFSPENSAIARFKRAFPRTLELPLSGNHRETSEAVKQAMNVLAPRAAHLNAGKQSVGLKKSKKRKRGEISINSTLSDPFVEKAFGRAGNRCTLDSSPLHDRNSGCVTCLTFESEELELTALGTRIRQMIKQGVKPSDIGIAAVRRHGIMDSILGALSAAGVPAVSGSIFSNILDRETPRSLMSLLRCLVHPSESTPLLHLLMTCPAYALPAGELTAALEGHMSRYVPLRSFLHDIHLAKDENHPRGAGISDGARAIAGRLLADVHKFARLAQTRGTREVMLDFLRHTGQLEGLKEPKSWQEEQEARAVAAFFNVTVMAEEQAGGDSVALVEPVLRLFRRHGMGYTTTSDFIHEEIEASDEASESTSDAVRVFSIRESSNVAHHSFHTVFVPFCTRSNLPGRVRSSRLAIPGPFRGVPEPRDTASVRTGDQLSRLWQENRARARLYAAVASAREEVCFSLAASVSRGKNQLAPSPFLSEILGERRPREWKGSSATTASVSHSRDATTKEVDDVSEKMEGPLSLSFSSISAYTLCPYSYYLQHVLNVTPPANPRMVYGRAMHEAVAACLRGAAGHGVGPPPTLQTVLEEFNRHFHGCAFESAAQVSALTDLGTAGLESFLVRLLQVQRNDVAEVGDNGSNGPDGKTTNCVGEEVDLPPPRLLVERKFRVQVPEADVILSGVFDRVDVWPGVSEDAPARRVSVTDYKSNVGSKDPRRMVRDSLQLRLYSLAAERLFGTKPEEVVIESVEDGRRGVARPAPADAELALEAISNSAAGVRAEIFQATPSFQACSFCGFKHMCRHSAVLNAVV